MQKLNNHINKLKTLTIMKTLQKSLLKFLQLHLNTYSTIPLTILGIHQAHRLTDDPGNEFLFFISLQPTDPNTYYSEHEPCINIRKLNNHLSLTGFSNGDYAVTAENYIGLNTIILLPITFLK